jgi:hypothetical protein
MLVRFTRCDVKFSSDDTVTALLTTTQVSEAKTTWEVTGPEIHSRSTGQTRCRPDFRGVRDVRLEFGRTNGRVGAVTLVTRQLRFTAVVQIAPVAQGICRGTAGTTASCIVMFGDSPESITATVADVSAGFISRSRGRRIPTHQGPACAIVAPG